MTQRHASVRAAFPGSSGWRTWRCLNGYEKLPRVIQGVKFTDGIPADETETRAAVVEQAVVAGASSEGVRMCERSGGKGVHVPS